MVDINIENTFRDPSKYSGLKCLTPEDVAHPITELKIDLSDSITLNALIANTLHTLNVLSGTLTSTAQADLVSIILNTNTVIIKNHKSNRTYNGYIHPIYKDLISNRMENISPIDYLVNSQPTELNRVSINKVLQPIFDKLFNEGLKAEDSKRRVVIHTLRHTFAFSIQGHMAHAALACTSGF